MKKKLDINDDENKELDINDDELKQEILNDQEETPLSLDDKEEQKGDNIPTVKEYYKNNGICLSVINDTINYSGFNYILIQKEIYNNGSKFYMTIRGKNSVSASMQVEDKSADINWFVTSKIPNIEIMDLFLHNTFNEEVFLNYEHIVLLDAARPDATIESILNTIDFAIHPILCYDTKVIPYLHRTLMKNSMPDSPHEKQKSMIGEWDAIRVSYSIDFRNEFNKKLEDHEWIPTSGVNIDDNYYYFLKLFDHFSHLENVKSLLSQTN